MKKLLSGKYARPHGAWKKSEIACLILCAFVCRASAAAGRQAAKFDSNGVKIAYAVHGKGEAVILIHGWLSSGWINWELPGTVGMLAKNYQAITVDMPAHGASDKPTKEEAYGLELVEDVVRLMDHLKIKKAHVVGYSMGGIIAAKLVAKHPQRVLSAALGGMGWLREGGIEQKLFAQSRKDDKPAGHLLPQPRQTGAVGARGPLDTRSGDDPFRRPRRPEAALRRPLATGAEGLARDRDQGRGPHHVHPQAAIPGRDRQLAREAEAAVTVHGVGSSRRGPCAVGHSVFRSANGTRSVPAAVARPANRYRRR